MLDDLFIESDTDFQLGRDATRFTQSHVEVVYVMFLCRPNHL